MSFPTVLLSLCVVVLASSRVGEARPFQPFLEGFNQGLRNFFGEDFIGLSQPPLSGFAPLPNIPVIPEAPPIIPAVPPSVPAAPPVAPAPAAATPPAPTTAASSSALVAQEAAGSTVSAPGTAARSASSLLSATTRAPLTVVGPHNLPVGPRRPLTLEEAVSTNNLILVPEF